MALETRNDAVNTPSLFWTELLAENVSSPKTTDRVDIPWDYVLLRRIVISIIIIIIYFCGLVGNGIVIWLLGFCMKRNHYGVYILNLAIADFTFLSSDFLAFISNVIFYSYNLIPLTHMLSLCSYSVGIILLMIISIERCVSVIWPIWYKCHRPAHLSNIACSIIWACFLISSSAINIFNFLEMKVKYIMWIIHILIPLPTFLVLFVSSLTLFIRVQCYSQQRKHSRLYWTILLNILAFLLLSIPNRVTYVCSLFMEPTFLSPGIMTIMDFLLPLNSAVNPIIYFFIGHNRQQGGRKPLKEILQRALMDDDEEAEQKRGRTSFPDRA